MFVGKIRDFLGLRDVGLKILLGSVNHHIGETGYDCLLDLFQICSMVKMKAERNFRISLSDSLCRLRDQLQRANILNCPQGSHQDNRRVLGSGAFHNADHLRDRAEIKCSYRVPFFRLRICRRSKSDRVSHDLFHR